MSSRGSLRLATESSHCSPEELRVQLEGSWEVLERAQAHKAALLKGLDSFRWRHHLQRDPELPRRVRELDAPLAQALERVEHRLRQESWPEHHPLHRLTRQLHALDARLRKRVRQRLAFWEPEGEWSFTEGLVRLEAWARAPLLQVPGEAEPVLMTGGVDYFAGGRAAFFLSMFLAIPGRALGLTLMEYRVLGFLLLVGLPLLLGLLRRRTRFWLTPRRLVWRTARGQVKQLALDSLHYAFTFPLVARTGLVVRREGGPRSLLAGMRNLAGLRVVLTLRGLPALRGQAQSAPTYALAMFTAVRREKVGLFKGRYSGVLVMRPGQLVFLEDRHIWNMVRVLFREALDNLYGLTPSMLLLQLQLLPEAEFDRCLEQLTPAGGGSRWSFSDVTHGLTADDKYQVVLPDGSVIAGTPDATQHAAISRVLQLGRART
ncbi:hypothetical protein ACN28E_44300 [Archangium lansingense]|uniref:hypothetical protein n=1 Tax=Archangium lansingense TaxID=2995310 RepID=UPI003B8141FC